MTKHTIEGSLAYLRDKGQEIPQERDILVKVSVAVYLRRRHSLARTPGGWAGAIVRA